MEVSLKATVGAAAGQEIPVRAPKFYIGRAEDCHLRPRSELISRHHCVLLVDEAFVAVRDFGSKNGTFINGERVVGEQTIKPGDILKVGPLEFELCASGKVSAQKRPKVQSVGEAAARAAEARSPNEIDVSAWITPEDEKAADDETRRVVAHETDRIDVNMSDTMQPGADVAVQPGADLAAAAEAETPPTDKPAKKTPGKLPPRPKHKTVDSGSAANDVLRDFFRRR